MKISEIRDRGDEELRRLGQTLRRELWKARFDNHAGQLDSTAVIGRLRRDIAKVETILTERRGQQESSAS